MLHIFFLLVLMEFRVFSYEFTYPIPLTGKYLNKVNITNKPMIALIHAKSPQEVKATNEVVIVNVTLKQLRIESFDFSTQEFKSADTWI